MKCFLRTLSFFTVMLLIFSSCGEGSIKISKNEDTDIIDDSDDMGNTGNTGNSGNTGDSGDTGNSGDTGDTGNTGNTGNTGDTVPETCGNEIVNETEVCDGNVANCVDIDAKLYSGGKAKCLDTCLGWDTSTCDEIPHTCGNEIVEGPEECDGNTVNCNELDPEKFKSGKAKCFSDCSGYDTMTCEEYEPSICGNEIVEGKEVCDGNLANCVDIDPEKFSGGKAYCKDDCTGWDEVTCDEKPVCDADYKVIKCSTDSNLDQIQTCFEGIWSNKGACLEPGMYAILEKDAAKKNFNLDFNAAPDGTDIVLIFDTSGSMLDELSVLQNNISVVTSNIRSYIPDSSFGLVSLGTLGYSPYLPLQNITDDLTLFNSKVSALTSGNGSYEYHTLTIEQTASGSGTAQSISTYSGGSVYQANVAAASCASGLRGGVCMRENSLPVVILMSDEVFDTSGWIWSVGTETTINDAADSMTAINAKIAVIDSSGDSKYLETNTGTLADGTYSYDQAGNPFYYSIPTAGTGIDLKVEEAVKTMYDETVMTVGLAIESDSGNTMDATQFVESFKTVSATPAEGVSYKDNSYFYDTVRDTTLRYSVSFENTDSTPSELTILSLKIKLKWNSITLDTKDFTVVIP